MAMLSSQFKLLSVIVSKIWTETAELLFMVFGVVLGK